MFGVSENRDTKKTTILIGKNEEKAQAFGVLRQTLMDLVQASDPH